MKYLFFLLISLIGGKALALEPKSLLVSTNDGLMKIFSLSEKTKLTFDDVITISDQYKSISFSIEEIQNIQYSNDECTSIQNIFTDYDVVVFFNDDTIQINSPFSISVSIFNSNGKLEMINHVNSDETTFISLSSLTSGIHILSVGPKIYKLCVK